MEVKKDEINRRPRLGDKEAQILDFIIHFISKNGYSPSFREIANGCSLTLAQVGVKLRRLRRLGVINYKDRQPRTIALFRYRLTKKGMEASNKAIL